MRSISNVVIRQATIADAGTIADFNLRLARETEETSLERETVLKGVRALLSDDARGRYFVAESDGIVGQLMHTREWSDWRNGDIWWIQSVYVHPDVRRQGVFRALYGHLQTLAEADPEVVGIRLYVERDNQTARATYTGLGMTPARYLIMEHLFRTDATS